MMKITLYMCLLLIAASCNKTESVKTNSEKGHIAYHREMDSVTEEIKKFEEQLEQLYAESERNSDDN